MINTTEQIVKIAEHVKAIMDLLGIEPTESNKETPMRIAKMYATELFKSIGEDINPCSMTLFPVEGDRTKPITLEVPFCSVCEHHWLPFYGKVTVSYIPNERIIGLSKIPRVIKHFSRRPQLQERLTADIGEFLWNTMSPVALTVVITAEHMCVSMRGAETPCKTTTTWVGGQDE